MKKQWNIVHECDDDNGEPTCWVFEINHKRYGKYVWISLSEGNMYHVEVSCSEYGMDLLKICKSLTSGKRWVSINL